MSITVSRSVLSEYVPKVVPFDVPDEPRAFEADIVQLLKARPVVPSAKTVFISDNLSFATTACAIVKSESFLYVTSYTIVLPG